MKLLKHLMFFLLFVLLTCSSVHAQTKVATFGRADSNNQYYLEAKTDGVVYQYGGFAGLKELATTSDTLTIAESGKTVIVNSSTPATFTLPTAQAGLSYRFISATNVIFHVDPQSSDTLVYSVGAVALAAGEKASSPGATNDTIEVMATTTGNWYVTHTDAFTNGG